MTLPRGRRLRVASALTFAAALVAGAVSPASPASAASTVATPSTSWAPFKPCPNGKPGNCASVRAIAHTGSGTVFLGGDFSSLRSPGNTQSIAISNLAALDASGSPLPGFRAHSFNGTVFALTTDGATVTAGGAFTKVDGAGALRMARFDASTGVRRAFKSGVKGTVFAAVQAGGRLYVGGRFGTVQGQPRGNLAALDAATGTLDPAWTPQATLIANDVKPNDPKHNNTPVRDLEVSADGARVYVAGDFDLLDGQARPALAAVDPVTGATDATFTPKLGGINKSFQGFQIALAPGTGNAAPGVVLAAGGVTNKAWRFNLDGTSAWVVNADGDLQAAAVLGDTVYLGGHFTCVSTVSCYDANTADDVRRIHVAAFPYASSGNPQADPTWAPALAPTWAPYYYGVWTLEAFGGDVYAGGVWNKVVSGGKTYGQPKFARFAAVG